MVIEFVIAPDTPDYGTIIAVKLAIPVGTIISKPSSVILTICENKKAFTIFDILHKAATIKQPMVA